MKSILVLALAAIAQAGSSIYTAGVCVTLVGTKSTTPVPTTKTTLSKAYTLTVKSTQCLTSTITPPAVTTTSTAIATSTATTTSTVSSGTFTSSTTVFVTSAITSISTVTVTSVSTATTTTTSTVLPPQFTPLKSQLAAQGYTPAKRDLKENEIALEPRAAQTSQSQYPTKVLCVTSIKTVVTSTSTVPGKTISTTIKPTTSVIVTTSTVTVTSTALATTDQTTVTATETSTQSSTIFTSTVVTSTSTEVYTVTATEVAPVVTQGTCSDANYVSSVNGGRADKFTGNGFLAYSDSTSVANCCQQCETLGSSYCGAGIFLITEQKCFLQTSGTNTCDVRNTAIGFTSTPDGATPSRVIFNGPCGRANYSPPSS